MHLGMKLRVGLSMLIYRKVRKYKTCILCEDNFFLIRNWDLSIKNRLFVLANQLNTKPTRDKLLTFCLTTALDLMRSPLIFSHSFAVLLLKWLCLCI